MKLRPCRDPSLESPPISTAAIEQIEASHSLPTFYGFGMSARLKIMVESRSSFPYPPIPVSGVNSSGG